MTLSTRILTLLLLVVVGLLMAVGGLFLWQRGNLAAETARANAATMKADQNERTIGRMSGEATALARLRSEAEARLSKAQAAYRTKTKGIDDVIKIDPPARAWADAPLPSSIVRLLDPADGGAGAGGVAPGSP